MIIPVEIVPLSGKVISTAKSKEMKMLGIIEKPSKNSQPAVSFWFSL